jgi:hypothetical protein
VVGEQTLLTSLDAQPSDDDRGNDLPTEGAHHTVCRGDGATRMTATFVYIIMVNRMAMLTGGLASAYICATVCQRTNT